MKRLMLRLISYGVSLGAAGAMVAAEGDGNIGAKAGNDAGKGNPVVPMPTLDIPEIKLPPKTQIPEDMKQLVESFQQQAQSYVNQQKELWKQTKGATAEERQRLVEQLKSTRQAFLDQTRDIRADIKERIKDLKVSIKESRPQTAGAGEAGGRRRHGSD